MEPSEAYAATGGILLVVAIVTGIVGAFVFCLNDRSYQVLGRTFGAILLFICALAGASSLVSALLSVWIQVP